MLLPSTGISLFVGRTGAGKSLVLVRKIMALLLSPQARPVFTNLPLVDKEVRAFLRLKGGMGREDLVHPLTEAHWSRFLARFVALQAAISLGGEAARVGFDLANPAVTRGSEANWIPARALVVIDEIQDWAPNKAIVGTAEPALLLEWLTMHRHLLHEIWFATQALRQVSPTIKSLAAHYWEIRDMSDEKIVWGLRWRHLGIRACAYRQFAAMDWAQDGAQRGELALRSFIVLPTMPWNRWSFRLYRSFSHFGGQVAPEVVSSLRVRNRPKLSLRGRAGRRELLRWLSIASICAWVVLFGFFVAFLFSSKPSPASVEKVGQDALFEDRIVSSGDGFVVTKEAGRLVVGSQYGVYRVLGCGVGGVVLGDGVSAYFWGLRSLGLKYIGSEAGVCALAAKRTERGE